MNERDRRRYVAIESQKLRWGAISHISELLGCDDERIRQGRAELEDAEGMGMQRIPRLGGRRSMFEKIEGLDAAFLNVLSQHTAGPPTEETVKWTHLNRPEITQLLQAVGIKVSVPVTDQLLK